MTTNLTVELAEVFTRWPFFEVEAGATGTITTVHEHFLEIKLDKPVEGAEEWDNCLIVDLPDEYEELQHIRITGTAEVLSERPLTF